MIQILIGAKVFYAENLEKLISNMGIAKPTIMTAVPRFYQNLFTKININFEKQKGLKKLLISKTLDLGKKMLNKNEMTFFEKIQNFICQILVRKKIRNQFGGNLQAFVSGGGALDKNVGEFLNAIGLPTLQGYGLTETSPVVSCNLPNLVKVDTVGPPFRNNEVRIASDGEILIRGENVMLGYWNQQEATQEVLKNGWLHTGDIGVLEEDGSLRITDRKKDIIVNSGGDNIAPARVEGVITVEPEFLQAMVYGDKKPYLVGVVVPSEAFIEEWCKGEGNKITLSDLSADKDFNGAVQGVMSRVNSRLSQIEKVRHIIVADEPFTTENGLMTPTLKIKRHKILQNYKQKLESLYRRP